MFLTNLFRAATPDNPRFSLNDPQAWDVFLGGQPAASGVRVTRETAMSYAPWWRGVSLVSGDVGKLTCRVYRLGPKSKTPDRTHPAWRLLRRKPNEYQTAFVFKQLLTGHALTAGNGYAYIDRDGAARPLSLAVLDPNDVTPCREGGRPLYVVDVDLGDGRREKRKVAAENIFHVRGFGLDPLNGYSVFDKARESIGLGVAARKFGSVFFRNNARPNLAVEVSQRLNETQLQDFRNGWDSMQGGLENAHKLAVLMGGAKLVPFSINARDSQLLETRQFEVREIALWLGLPPHKLGDASKASYNSLEQENQDYLDGGLDPWLRRFEEEAWDKLLTEQEKREESHEILFDRNELVRANLADRGNYNRIATGGRAWKTPDEVREEEGLDPVGGQAGDLMDPLNMAGQPPPGGPADQPPPAPPQRKQPPKPPAKDNGAARAVVEDAARRMVRRLGHAARAAAKRPEAFMQWLEALDVEHQGVFVEALTPAAMLVGRLPGDVAGRLYEPLKAALLGDAAQCTAKRLPEWLDRYFTDMEATLPAALAAQLLEPDACDTTTS